ncbi:hypothetical protein PR048_026572 [Dryococelus australis]|uniref:Uncharacterized protein n=1 Tax=Dryococelus australis TaxID=614101 RepID=A0ABQ9GLP5_9NEOP|nr:hypothetical protein PR048_026572 [Dryococelus australis]
MKGRGKRENPEKTRRPTASSGTIPTCENPLTRPGIEPGSTWWEASVLIAQPPWALKTSAGPDGRVLVLPSPPFPSPTFPAHFISRHRAERSTTSPGTPSFPSTTIPAQSPNRQQRRQDSATPTTPPVSHHTSDIIPILHFEEATCAPYDTIAPRTILADLSNHPDRAVSYTHHPYWPMADSIQDWLLPRPTPFKLTRTTDKTNQACSGDHRNLGAETYRFPATNKTPPHHMFTSPTSATYCTLFFFWIHLQEGQRRLHKHGTYVPCSGTHDHQYLEVQDTPQLPLIPQGSSKSRPPCGPTGSSLAESGRVNVQAKQSGHLDLFPRLSIPQFRLLSVTVASANHGETSPGEVEHVTLCSWMVRSRPPAMRRLFPPRFLPQSQRLACRTALLSPSRFGKAFTPVPADMNTIIVVLQAGAGFDGEYDVMPDVPHIIAVTGVCGDQSVRAAAMEQTS